MAPDTSAQIDPQDTVEFSVQTHDTQDAFNELLVALNPYADELVYLPTFDLFTNLPAELRCKVYNEYFLEENRSLSCHGWPRLEFSKSFIKSIRIFRKSAPFLPNLCFASKELQDEILTCLLEAAHFELDDPLSVDNGTQLFRHSTFLQLTRKVRKVTLENINGMHKRLVFYSDPRTHSDIAHECVNSLNTIGSSFPYLRELAVTFYAPITYMAPANIHQMESTQAFSDHGYLGGVDYLSILNLRELQELSITGIKDYHDRKRRSIRFGEAVIEDGKAYSLVAILDLCRRINKGFKLQSQEVRITACLQYAPNKYTKEVFERKLPQNRTT
jgi:hypothetical protein